MEAGKHLVPASITKIVRLCFRPQLIVVRSQMHEKREIIGNTILYFLQHYQRSAKDVVATSPQCEVENQPCWSHPERRGGSNGQNIRPCHPPRHLLLGSRIRHHPGRYFGYLIDQFPKLGFSPGSSSMRGKLTPPIVRKIAVRCGRTRVPASATARTEA